MRRASRWSHRGSGIGIALWPILFIAWIYALDNWLLFFIPLDWKWRVLERSNPSFSHWHWMTFRQALSLILGILLSFYTLSLLTRFRDRHRKKPPEPPRSYTWLSETVHSWDTVVAIVILATIALRPVADLIERETGITFVILGDAGFLVWFGLVFFGFSIQRIGTILIWKIRNRQSTQGRPLHEPL